MGLAQLHQLRGRVGRGPLQAYAYLMYPSQISSAALERLHFLGETSYLGAGFDIAQRDLELRGAGRLMGKAQKGARSSMVNVSQEDFREQLLHAECELAVHGLVESVLCELAGQVSLESAHTAVADALDETATTAAARCDDATSSHAASDEATPRSAASRLLSSEDELWLWREVARRTTFELSEEEHRAAFERLRAREEACAAALPWAMDLEAWASSESDEDGDGWDAYMGRIHGGWMGRLRG